MDEPNDSLFCAQRRKRHDVYASACSKLRMAHHSYKTFCAVPLHPACCGHLPGGCS